MNPNDQRVMAYPQSIRESGNPATRQTGAGRPVAASSSARLNVLALPSLPVWYFVLMALSIGSIFLLIGAPGSPALVGPFPFVFLVAVVLRDYLIQPEREARRHGLHHPGPAEGLAVQEALPTLARGIGLRRTPSLRVAATPGALFALGSLRHFYVVIGTDLLAVLERDLRAVGRARRRAEAALLHELEHIRQGDLVVVGLGRSLLKMSVWFSVFSMLFSIGVAVFSFAYPITELFTPAYQQQLQRAAPELAFLWPLVIPTELPEAARTPPELGLAIVFILNGFMPLVMTVSALALLVWPPLLRIRELYADAGAALHARTTAPMWEALTYYGSYLRLGSAPASTGLLALAQNLRSAASLWLGRWFRVHPTTAEREGCLAQPEQVFRGVLALGLLAGVLVTLLDTLSVGVFSLSHTAQVPAALPVLIGVFTASIALLPAALENRAGVHEAGWIIGCVLMCRLGWHGVNLIGLWIGVMLAPEWLSDMLSSFVQTAAGVLVTIPEARVAPQDLVDVALKSTAYWIYFSVLLSATLTGAVALDHALRRQVLTWYRLPGGLVWLKWALGGATASVLALVVGLWLPLAALVAPISPTEPYSWLGWSILCLVGLGVLAAGAVLLIAHTRYAGRCPRCMHPEPGAYTPGRRCQTCGAELWEGLWR